MIDVPPSRDHTEVDLGTAAGVSDRGLRHSRNEDAMSLASQQTPDRLVVVAVVCDGVSSSPRPDEASRVAADAALPVLVAAVQAGGDLDEASRAAVQAGRESVAGGMIEAGLASEEAAMASPHAHVLTRWLGAEAADLAGDPAREPHVEQYSPPGTGTLLVCSDGLWNYLPEAADLAGLALPKAQNDPLGAALDMVQFAIDAGGADNITVVLIPYPAPGGP